MQPAVAADLCGLYIYIYSNMYKYNSYFVACLRQGGGGAACGGGGRAQVGQDQPDLRHGALLTLGIALILYFIV